MYTVTNDFVPGLKCQREINWELALGKAATQDREPTPPQKVFKAKNDNLLLLDKYPEGVDLGDHYWGKWREKPYEIERGSLMDHRPLERIAEEVGYIRRTKLAEIVRTLRDGADLGIEGEGRWPSHGRNNISIETYG